MQYIQVSSDPRQLEWEMAVSMTQIGRILRTLGFVISYLTILVALTLAFYFFIEMEGRDGVLYAAASALSGVPSLALGQLLALQGTRAILRGLSTQTSIVERDTLENGHDS